MAKLGAFCCLKKTCMMIPCYFVILLILNDWYSLVVQWAFMGEHENLLGVYLVCNLHF